jgi:hypothetical protein
MLKDNLKGISSKKTARPKDIFLACVGVIVVVGISVLVASCTTKKGYDITKDRKPSEQFPSGTNRIYDLEIKEVRKVVMTTLPAPPLEIGIMSEQHDRIETAYEEYPGEKHGIWPFARRYQERTKYIINLFGRMSGSDEMQTALIIESETQQRRNEKHPWELKEFADVEERILEILNAIDRKVRELGG